MAFMKKVEKCFLNALGWILVRVCIYVCPCSVCGHAPYMCFLCNRRGCQAGQVLNSLYPARDIVKPQGFGNSLRLGEGAKGLWRCVIAECRTWLQKCVSPFPDTVQHHFFSVPPSFSLSLSLFLLSISLPPSLFFSFSFFPYNFLLFQVIIIYFQEDKCYEENKLGACD